MSQKYLTPAAAAARLGISQRQILAMARQGVVQSVPINARVIRFKPEALAALGASLKR